MRSRRDIPFWWWWRRLRLWVVGCGLWFVWEVVMERVREREREECDVVKVGGMMRLL